MDYFSELLESYTKLKKRTFKLTYINEDEEASGKEQYIDAVKAAGEEVFKNKETQEGLGNSQNITIEYIPDNQEKRVGEKIKVTGSNLGFGMSFNINKWLTAFKKPINKQSNASKILSAWAGLSDEPKGPKTPEQEEAEIDAVKKNQEDEAARQAELEEQAAEKAPYHFEKAGYSLDKNNPENISQGIAAVERTMVGLNQYCDGFEDPEKAPRICSPTMRTRLISSNHSASFSAKLANAQVVMRDEDGRRIEGGGQAPPGLLSDVAENHEEFISFIYSPESDPQKLEEKCQSLNKKVGFHNDNIIIFGKSMDSDGKPSNGLTFSTKENKLYLDAIKAVRNSCGDKWKPEETYTNAVENSASLNTIRGSINERALVLAIVMDDPNATEEERRAAYRQLVMYAVEKEESLIKFTQELYAGDEQKTQDMMSYHESQVLLEEAGIAEREGVPGVIRYLLESVQRTRGFVSDLGANDAYDNSKGGGQGDRADVVAVFDTEEKARDAAIRIGLDPDEAVRNGRPGTKGEGKFEIGIGQKLQAGDFDGIKQGEYNTNARRRAAIRGELTDDPKFDRGFYVWADTLQFGGPVDQPPAQERYEAFLEFEEDMESSIESIETSMVSGRVYVDRDGNIRSQSGEEVCGAVARQFTSVLKYQGPEIGPEAPRDAQEFHDVFFGKTNWDDVAEREKGVEAVSRKARMRTVQQAVEDPESYLEAKGALEGLSPEEREAKIARTRQAGEDWIVRNMLLTGGDSRDICQLVTSTKTGKSLAVDHNSVFRKISTPPPPKEGEEPQERPFDHVSFKFSGFKIQATVNSEGEDLSTQLGFERTDATKGSGRARETRTVSKMDKQTTQSDQVSREYKADRTQKGKPKKAAQEESALHTFIRSQVQLFEQFLNSSK